MLYLLPNKAFYPLLVLSLSLLFPVHGQQMDFVKLASPPELDITAGEEQLITLSFRIKDGFHIQADQVKDENLIPSYISFEPSPGLSFGEPVYPPAEEFWMEGSAEALLVFSDAFEIQVPVLRLPSATAEGLLLKGKLHYQACDASKCYFPRDLEFVLKLGSD